MFVLASTAAAQDATLRVRVGDDGVVLTAGDLRALPRHPVSVAEGAAQVRYEGPRLDPDYSDREVVLALRRNGAPLVAEEGRLRLVAPGDRRRTRWVRQVDALAVLTAPVVK